MPAIALVAGTLFAKRYEVVRPLKQGGMGCVYEVLDQRTRRRRALKLMVLEQAAGDLGLRDRFRREATVAADVDSTHIVEVFDAGVDDETGSPYLVMELLRGRDLGAELQARGRLPPNEVVALLGQVARALESTHAEGIVHRDLKPENLFLIAREDGTFHVKVLDFGIAKIVAGAADAETTGSLGTPLYMAPEQLRGDGTLDARVDLYALAHVAYALLVGEAYWEPEHRASATIFPFLAKVARGAREPATRRAAKLGVELPPEFDPWFVQATHVRREKRFANAAAQVVALGAALGVAAPEIPAARAPTAPRVRVQEATADELRPEREVASTGSQVGFTTKAAAQRARPRASATAIGIAVALLATGSLALLVARSGRVETGAPEAPRSSAVAAAASVGDPPMASIPSAPERSESAAPVASASVAPRRPSQGAPASRAGEPSAISSAVAAPATAAAEQPTSNATQPPRPKVNLGF